MTETDGERLLYYCKAWPGHTYSVVSINGRYFMRCDGKKRAIPPHRVKDCINSLKELAASPYGEPDE